MSKHPNEIIEDLEAENATLKAALEDGRGGHKSRHPVSHEPPIEHAAPDDTAEIAAKRAERRLPPALDELLRTSTGQEWPREPILDWLYGKPGKVLNYYGFRALATPGLVERVLNRLPADVDPMPVADALRAELGEEDE